LLVEGVEVFLEVAEDEHDGAIYVAVGRGVNVSRETEARGVHVEPAER
jgi:hypothetical protein